MTCPPYITGMIQPLSKTHLARRQEVLETIQTHDLVASWKNDFGIDVARLFEGSDTLYLMRDTETELMTFEPTVEGDAPFYQALRRFHWYHPKSKSEFAAAARWKPRDGKVVDIGAGAATFAEYVGWVLYRGLETDPVAAHEARSKGLDVLTMDMLTYQQSPHFEASDMATAFQVLEHVEDADAFVGQMVDLVKPGGRIALGVPDAQSYVADLPDFMLNAPPHHLSWWTETALRSVLERQDLKILSVERFSVEPWERQLWWMAQLAKIGRTAKSKRFGAAQKWRKILSYVISWPLQFLPLPRRARGSTLLMIAEKPA